MTVEQYADALIEDAPKYLPEDLLNALKTQTYDSKFDRALTYLAQIPAGEVRILTMQAA